MNFLFYLLFVSIATDLFDEAFGQEASNGWIVSAMWIGCLGAFVVALGAIFLLVVTILDERVGAREK